ncbi:hypothetical protein X744_31925 [Mesorhizobium sp. LNJC372A00]|nr:hypothetical protein X744_31925 [Mesorhizobium sp. LNJC372A00]
MLELDHCESLGGLLEEHADDLQDLHQAWQSISSGGAQEVAW